MKKFYRFISFLFILIIIHSCKSNSVDPIDKAVDSDSDYHQISITQIDYTSFEVSDNSNFVLSSKKISSVILGSINSGIFSGKDTLQAVYEPIGDKFKLKFKFNETVDDSIIIFQFSLRYLFTDNGTYDLDTFKVTYKYPYQSTEILMKCSNLTLPYANVSVQAFDIVDSVLYYHPFGSFGLYKYNLESEQASLLLHYDGGNHLAATSNFIFCDINHFTIYRFNIDSNKVDKQIESIGLQDIQGMTVYENKLYVVTMNGDISAYDFDLQLERTITLSSFRGAYITIKNDIAYFNDFEKIIRVNLATLDILSSIKPPTSGCEAINIIGDKMYFTDVYKQIICSVDISELN